MDFVVQSNNFNQVVNLYNQGYLPSQETLNYAASKGYVDIIRFFGLHGIFPKISELFPYDGAANTLNLICAGTRKFLYEEECRKYRENPNPDAIRQQYPKCFGSKGLFNRFGDCSKVRAIEQKERIVKDNPDCNFTDINYCGMYGCPPPEYTGKCGKAQKDIGFKKLLVTPKSPTSPTEYGLLPKD